MRPPRAVAPAAPRATEPAGGGPVAGAVGELARPSFTRQAHYGPRVIFAWSPAASSPVNPLTVPWPLADELIEGLQFADEAAARRFDLTRLANTAGPYHEFFTWEAAERWLREGVT